MLLKRNFISIFLQFILAFSEFDTFSAINEVQHCTRLDNISDGSCISRQRCPHLIEYENTESETLTKLIINKSCFQPKVNPLISYVCCSEKKFMIDYSICGRKYAPQAGYDRIFGGKDAELDQYPWHVLLMYQKVSYSACAGTIINKKYVLTACHCVSPGLLNAAGDIDSIFIPQSSLLDYRGIDSISTYQEKMRKKIKIRTVICHPQYDEKTKFNDIALLRLNEEINFNELEITPICLPNTTFIPSVHGDRVKAIGFGKTENDTISPILQEVDLTIVDNEACSNFYSNITIEDSQMCAKGEVGKDTCDGDSGGALMTSQNGQWILEGLTSYGTDICGIACHKVNPESDYFCCKQPFAFAQLPSYDNCGSADTTFRIAGGEDADVSDYRWHAMLLYEKSGVLRNACGGAVISRKFVLTAAHCLKQKITETFGKVSKIRLGEHDTETEDESQTDDYEVEKIFIHPGYSESTKQNDIALIYLKNEVDFELYTPVCLPKQDFEDTQTGVQVQAIGFGNLGNDKGYPNIKQKVKLPIVDSNVCARRKINHESQICAGGEPGKDTCDGDSGGSLVTKRNKNWILEGIVSFGVKNCTIGNPGVYTRVKNYRKWILETIRSMSN
uniref:CSON006991 protein n=1 Tax=Culicoides sonorensis TaxID=179676 RepID=A0A336L9X9_CULSO